MALDPAARKEFLVNACGSNTGLLEDVVSLLDAASDSEAYFRRISSEVGLPSLAASEQTLPEDSIVGNWRLKHVVGRGGMGAVYLAERADEQYEQEAALKVLPFGLDTDAARTRFLTERQILADLAHPNIARLLDGGVTSNGSPFFVMEYVDGLPIDAFCDNRELDVRARIRLFNDVLAAVSHAHARLVVHRDIKPSNVLVDSSGNVKLLDFGIAKLLRPDAITGGGAVTMNAAAALTPEYAAPEQLLGQAITTATDIYALGLMLYELLSGHKPRNTDEIDSYASLVEIATQDPPKASAATLRAERRGTSQQGLSRTLRGDLDNILQMALAPDPEDRYKTANAMAADLIRYLEGEPVSAMPPTLAYRTRKFVGRHRGGVATTLLTALALIVSLVVATSQMVEARKQRDAAIYQQQRVLASNEFLTLLLGEIGPKGEALSLGELLDRGVEMLDQSFGKDYRFLGRMYFDLANSYFSLGRTERMIELLGRAEAEARAQNDSDLLAGVLCISAVIQFRTDPEQSVSRAGEANRLLEDLGAPSMDSVAACARANGHIYELEGDRQAAILVLRDALTTLNASPLSSVQSRILVMNQLGNTHYSNGDRAETLSINEAILDLMERSGRSATAGYMINAMNRSVTLQSMGEVKTAFEIRQELLERVRELNDASKAPISMNSFYAASLMRLGRYEEGFPVALEALEAARAAGNDYWAAQDELQVGRILMYMGRLDEADSYLDSAEATFRRTPGASDRLLQAINMARAGVLLRRGESVAAQDMIDAELERLQYPDQKTAPGSASVLRVAAEIALANGEGERAERYASDAYELAVAAARDPALSANVGHALLLRAKARHMLGAPGTSARDDLAKAQAALINGLGEDSPLVQAAQAVVFD